MSHANQEIDKIPYLHSRQGCLYLAFNFSAAFQCCGDKQWGDWRPHLAVILSNQGGDPELYQRTIVTMGDTLGKQKPARTRLSSPLSQASLKHTGLRVLGSLLGPSLCLCLSFPPVASVFGGRNSRERNVLLALPSPRFLL